MEDRLIEVKKNKEKEEGKKEEEDDKKKRRNIPYISRIQTALG